MLKQKKKICLLLAGGTWTVDKSKNILAVNSADDLDNWLATMPELGILSDLDIHFLADEEVQVGVDLWTKIAKFLINKQNEFDGFVLVTKVETLVMSAVALNFLLQHFPKTLVLTASQMSGLYTKEKKERMQELISAQGGLGLRSNLINAVQAAGESLPSVAVMFGSRLVASVKARLEYQQGKYILLSVDDDYLAKIDFGISFKNNLNYPKVAAKEFSKLSQEVCILSELFSVQYLWPKEAFSAYKAILVFLSNEELGAEQKKYLVSLNKPIIIYHPHSLQQEKDFISLNSCTPETAVAKVLWLVENVEVQDWSKVIQSNIIDEFVKF